MENIFDDFEASIDEVVSSASKEVVLSEEEQAIEQRTKDWFRARLGKITDSSLNIIAKLLKNGDFSAAGKAELQRIGIERRMNPKFIDAYIDEQMAKEYRQTRWGNKYEYLCKESVEEFLGIKIENVGFKDNDSILNFGGSLDGKFQRWLFEFKCPYNMVKHDNLLRAGKIDRDHEHYPQIQGHLMQYPEADGCYYASCDPRQVGKYSLFITLVERDEDYIKWLEELIVKAEEFINAI